MTDGLRKSHLRKAPQVGLSEVRLPDIYHFLRPGVLTFLGAGRGCAGALTRPSTRHLLPKNFEKTALRKRVGIFTVKMRGGHIYGNYCKRNLPKSSRPSLATL